MTRRSDLIQEDLSHARDLLDWILAHHSVIDAEMRDLMTDGYPARTPGNGEPGGGSGISDPTPSAALHGGTPDALAARDDHDSYSDAIATLLRYVKVARDLAWKYEVIAGNRPAADPLDRGYSWCANRTCPDKPAIAVSKGRCATCARYWRDHGQDRTTKHGRAA